MKKEEFLKTLGEATSEMTWTLHARCRTSNRRLLQEEIDPFFHARGEREPRRTRRDEAAKAICARCPVIDACVRHALTVDERDGVWGGMTEEERIKLKSDAAEIGMTALAYYERVQAGEINDDETIEEAVEAS
jgi:WhiB family redox-sensing transcriptional regulator